MRQAAFAFPFACLTALAAHGVRFGDDHAFGGDANEGIVSVAIGGALLIAALVTHAFLTAGSTTVTGTIAASRVRALLPGTPLLFAVAAAMYYAVEMLEGNGIELGFPTVVLAALAALMAFTLRELCGALAGFVHGIVRECVARLSARPLTLAHGAPRTQALRAQILLTARRLGRAPPNERRFH